MISKKNTNYNEIIRHENIKIGIVQMLEKIPNGFESFKPLIHEFFIKNKAEILNQCNVNIKNDGIRLSSPSIWNFNIRVNYKKLKTYLINYIKNKENINYMDDNITKNILDKFEDKMGHKTASVILDNMNLDIDIINYLIDNNYINKEMLKIQDINGNTCLHIYEKTNELVIKKIIDSDLFDNSFLEIVNNKNQNIFMFFCKYNMNLVEYFYNSKFPLSLYY